MKHTKTDQIISLLIEYLIVEYYKYAIGEFKNKTKIKI